MNESGRSVGAAMRFYKLEPDAVLVVHDEGDFDLGRLQLRLGGGTAGHNGLESLRSHLHSGGFVRVRIGIGKPPGTMSGADYVLRRPSKSERAELDVAVEVAADAVEAVLSDGPEAAMNRFNTAPEPPLR
jgi:PTH1 family peptidyl-tRNA hydrolase